MAAIRRADTRPEVIIRRGLHARGLRFRLHDKKLPGRPDLVFARFRVALFVNGCFWHGHDCPLFRWPATRTDFWKTKIMGNVARDLRNDAQLSALGWRIGVVWECAVKGPGRQRTEQMLDELAAAIRGTAAVFGFQGLLSGTDRVVRAAD
ncbi:very short patch repair endonuclease [Defluviimonas salinarum]|uniref:Very short patch repair endonuclease n=1 Tax=Defluviimonas salinarum TaxID=2992147 RepID=A0ABT3J9T7_9RHOB|nr:very short patch repair endonuclease [Defluviimonas salinarum]MCW3784225.1 very short patch repair endonuclease [Defluviimonas salinarum]